MFWCFAVLVSIKDFNVRDAVVEDFCCFHESKLAYLSNMRNYRKISGSLYRKKYGLIIVAIFLSQCFIQSKPKE